MAKPLPDDPFDHLFDEHNITDIHNGSTSRNNYVDLCALFIWDLLSDNLFVKYSDQIEILLEMCETLGHVRLLSSYQTLFLEPKVQNLSCNNDIIETVKATFKRYSHYTHHPTSENYNGNLIMFAHLMRLLFNELNDKQDVNPDLVQTTVQRLANHPNLLDYLVYPGVFSIAHAEIIPTREED